jgi:hypothetical protein
VQEGGVIIEELVSMEGLQLGGHLQYKLPCTLPFVRSRCADQHRMFVGCKSVAVLARLRFQATRRMSFEYMHAMLSGPSIALTPLKRAIAAAQNGSRLSANAILRRFLSRRTYRRAFTKRRANSRRLAAKRLATALLAKRGCSAPGLIEARSRLQVIF